MHFPTLPRNGPVPLASVAVPEALLMKYSIEKTEHAWWPSQAATGLEPCAVDISEGGSALTGLRCCMNSVLPDLKTP
jgi:hypothetical protein